MEPITMQDRVVRACPVCGKQEHRHYLAKRGLKLVQCVACGMIYVNELDRAFADGSFYAAEAAPFYLSEEKLRGDYAPTRYARETRLLQKHVKSGAVLDVGCSTGGFLWQLNRARSGDYRIYGMDVPSEATRFASGKGVEILPGEFLARQDESRFDAITFWAVLEHVAAPGEFLKQANRLLKPGGRCFVLVPNIRSLAVRMLGGRYRYILPQHLNYFSGGTLRRLAESAGLEIVETRTMHFNPLVIWQDRKNANGLVSDADRVRLLGKTNAMKESKALAPRRMAYGTTERLLGALGLADNVAVVARKKAPVGETGAVRIQ
jgi:2-polyprenyl-3-methyl-5-hydroxy-6-metoxy-1,4-benzoquinol methylase/Zn ribbon nucleic-acid-binding protein